MANEEIYKAVTLGWTEKDPADTDVFGVDFSGPLEGEAVVGSPLFGVQPISSPPLVTDMEQMDGPIALALFSGGVGGQRYTATVRVTTNSGRVIERTFGLRVSDL